jgi:hypothetical protein
VKTFRLCRCYFATSAILLHRLVSTRTMQHVISTAPFPDGIPRVGGQVQVLHEDGLWYPGKLTECDGNKWRIDFEDGDTDIYTLPHRFFALSPCRFPSALCLACPSLWLAHSADILAWLTALQGRAGHETASSDWRRMDELPQETQRGRHAQEPRCSSKRLLQ